MKITIITINFNNSQGLESTIKSVISQTRRKNIEYIVIDGASTDGSIDIIHKYAGDIDFWISEKDNGIYNAMNKGIKHAHGQYCLFLNSSDILSSSKSIERIIDKKWIADIVQCDIFYKSSKFNNIYNRVFSPDKISFQLFLQDSLYHQSSFIRTALLQEEGYTEEFRLVSDWAYFFKKLIIEDRSYQHLNIPISIFDMGGISNSGNPRDAEERRLFLLRYFSYEILDVIIKQKGIDSVEEVTYMSGSQRTLLRNFRRWLAVFYSKLIYPFSIMLDNYKYIDRQNRIKL